jgi:hypothetical protein
LTVKKYCDILISFENSADEYLSYSLVEIIYNNPNIVTYAIKNIKKDNEKRYIVTALKNCGNIFI